MALMNQTAAMSDAQLLRDAAVHEADEERDLFVKTEKAEGAQIVAEAETHWKTVGVQTESMCNTSTSELKLEAQTISGILEAVQSLSFVKSSESRQAEPAAAAAKGAESNAVGEAEAEATEPDVTTSAPAEQPKQKS